MDNKIIIGVGILIILVISGFLIFPINAEINLEDGQATTEGIAQTINGNNEFAFDLYNKFNNEPENDNKNVFFSPYSISTALAMTYEGANGNTAQEMQSVLKFPEDDIVRQSSFARIQNILNKKDKEYKLNTANALWLQKDYSFLPDYLDTTQKYYYAEQNELDFMNENKKSVDTINSWVEDKTNDKIKNLILELSTDTRLVLTNAIYFKGDWLKKFDKDDTQKRDFNTGSGVVQADMMYQKDDFNYAETDELQVLEMDYKGEELSMVVLLPKESYGLNDIEINNENIKDWKSKLREQEVNVYFPKFEFDTKYGLVDTLKQMGIKDAFSSGNADFSGMNGDRDLFIGDVIHQAYVKVDEKGTEAAAATAIVMKATAVGPEHQIIFKADHEFIFLIKEKSTDQILFMGKVVNPNE